MWTHHRAITVGESWIDAISVLRAFRFLCLSGLMLAPLAADAASSGFDLVGPQIDIAVTHDGVTLPLERVPNLTEGDQIAIKLDLPQGKGERYRMVAAFLRGAIDRPASDWFHEAQSWKPKSATLSLVVPKGALQLALFITPESGGGAGAVIGTVRKQPGAFVRAVQELNQASLDRARLDAFLARMQQAERKSPASVAPLSPILARSLAIKLKEDCLQQPTELQAACLTQDRETLLLADSHSSALADTLTGAPTDLALQLSATPQAGYGLYSSYIGVVRDVFRLFGAFQSTQLQFIPTLTQMEDGRATILLNAPLSFAKPTSVMVVALPLIETPKPPPLRNPAPDTMLCARDGLVLPVEGGPLIYATGYAHDMTVRFKVADGTQVSVPVHADPGTGGFVLDGALPAGASGPVIEGQLHGDWGFSPFDGPSFALSKPDSGSWKAADKTSLVVGRSNDIELLGGGVGCVTQVGMRRGDGPLQPLTWKQSGTHGIVATVPLASAEPGVVSIVIEATGRPAPVEIKLRAFQEAGSLDELEFHAADPEAVLTGSRLDQVVGMTLGNVAFQPGALTRIGKQDRLALRATDPTQVQALVVGKTVAADVAFVSGRHKTLNVTVAPPRATVTLVQVSAQSPVRSGVLPVDLPSGRVFPQDARVTFAFHMNGSAPLSGRETIEVGTEDGRIAAPIEAGKGYDLQDATTGIVAFDPAETLGPTTYGPLRFRVVRNGETSGWAPLATVVRLPEIRSLTCSPGRGCKLSGNRLFLIKAVGTTADFQEGYTVPDGFVATEITVPAGRERRIFLHLRDAPDASAVVVAP